MKKMNESTSLSSISKKQEVVRSIGNFRRDKPTRLSEKCPIPESSILNFNLYLSGFTTALPSLNLLQFDPKYI
jgi:hypothetical protein